MAVVAESVLKREWRGGEEGQGDVSTRTLIRFLPARQKGMRAKFGRTFPADEATLEECNYVWDGSGAVTQACVVGTQLCTPHPHRQADRRKRDDCLINKPLFTSL